MHTLDSFQIILTVYSVYAIICMYRRWRWKFRS